MVQLLPVVLASLLAAPIAAQQFPLKVTYDTILKSPINPNITISYKQPTSDTCATAFSSQKQYSGYVNLPPFTLAPYQQNYSINTFFWFFEARNNPETSPLTIWLNGGPGSSSMVGLFQEMGPCEMTQFPNGSYSTQPRAFGWDRSSNILFIDQPTQVGFSYDELVNASVDFSKPDPFSNDSRVPPTSLPLGKPEWLFKNATLSSGRDENTQQSTAIAARACWHFLQGFLSAFPQYNPGTRPNRTTVEAAGVNLFAESYGGMYGPVFADYFEKQNDRRMAGTLTNSTLEIRIDSVGIINGMVDYVSSALSIPEFLRHHTYGTPAPVPSIDFLTYQNTISEILSPDGCRSMVATCRSRAALANPARTASDKATDELCSAALQSCNKALSKLASKVGKSVYDIRVTPDIGPSDAYQEYLNTVKVMQSIGAQVNFTQTSAAVADAFEKFGDHVRSSQLGSLADLLSRGVRVAFIYGDADVICNWYAGQNASLELASLLPSYREDFPAAGYADIVVNDSYTGGHVRQYGNLSFSRIFDAGHLVPYYQPETAFVVFSRIIQGDDISMGHNVNLSTYGTVGIRDSAVYHNNKLAAAPGHRCWVRDLDTCAQNEKDAIARGEGVVSNGLWALAPAPIVARPDTTILSMARSQLPLDAPKLISRTTTSPLTGVFTATRTPTPTSTSGGSRLRPLRFVRRAPQLALPTNVDTSDSDSSSDSDSDSDSSSATSSATSSASPSDSPSDSDSDSDSDDDDDGLSRAQKIWIAVPLGIFGLFLLFLIALLVAHCIRRSREGKAKAGAADKAEAGGKAAAEGHHGAGGQPVAGQPAANQAGAAPAAAGGQAPVATTQPVVVTQPQRA